MYCDSPCDIFACNSFYSGPLAVVAAEKVDRQKLPWVLHPQPSRITLSKEAGTFDRYPHGKNRRPKDLNAFPLTRQSMEENWLIDQHFQCFTLNPVMIRLAIKLAGRWSSMGDELFKLKDRAGNDFCLAPVG